MSEQNTNKLVGHPDFFVLTLGSVIFTDPKDLVPIPANQKYLLPFTTSTKHSLSKYKDFSGSEENGTPFWNRTASCPPVCYF